MLEVAGLPVETTESDLEELFSDYGTIQNGTFKIIKIEIKNNESVALVELENDRIEKKARDDLDRKLWRDEYSLRVDIRRGSGRLLVQERDRGDESEDSSNQSSRSNK